MTPKQSLLRHLEKYPLYRPEHRVEEHTFRCGHVCLHWHTEPHDFNRLGTHLDLNLIDGVLYVLSIRLKDEHRGKGLGRQLYRLVEEVARDLDCSRVEMTASGWTPRKESRGSYLARVLGYKLNGDVATKEISHVASRPVSVGSAGTGGHAA